MYIMSLPNVSILMPIYNRSIFLPLIELNIKGLIYDDRSKIELVIDDDGTDLLFKDKQSEFEFRKRIYPVRMKYLKYNTRRSIGAKRNNLTKMASHQLVACMDSDDIYMPTYLIYSISVMNKKNVNCVGSNQMLFVYPYHDYKITMIACEAKRQVHEACLVYTKKYHRSMGGFKKNSQGEGSKMVDFNDKNVELTDIDKCMMCVCHNENTINKDMFLDAGIIDITLTKEYIDILNNILNVSDFKIMSKKNLELD